MLPARGADNEIRTHDLCLTKAALYRWSYISLFKQLIGFFYIYTALRTVGILRQILEPTVFGFVMNVSTDFADVLFGFPHVVLLVNKIGASCWIRTNDNLLVRQGLYR